MEKVKIVMSENDYNQVIIRVPVKLLIKQLGAFRAKKLITPYATNAAPDFNGYDNLAGANIYNKFGYKPGHKTIKLLVSGHHQGEYKSTIDYLERK